MVQQRNFNNCFSTINIVYYCNVLYQQLYQHCLLIGTSGCSDNSCPKCTCSGSNTTTSMRQRQYLRRSYRWYRRRSDIDMVCICTGCNTTSRNCTSLVGHLLCGTSNWHMKLGSSGCSCTGYPGKFPGDD